MPVGVAPATETSSTSQRHPPMRRAQTGLGTSGWQTQAYHCHSMVHGWPVAQLEELQAPLRHPSGDSAASSMLRVLPLSFFLPAPDLHRLQRRRRLLPHQLSLQLQPGLSAGLHHYCAHDPRLPGSPPPLHRHLHHLPPPPRLRLLSPLVDDAAGVSVSPRTPSAVRLSILLRHPDQTSAQTLTPSKVLQDLAGRGRQTPSVVLSTKCSSPFSGLEEEQHSRRAADSLSMKRFRPWTPVRAAAPLAAREALHLLCLVLQCLPRMQHVCATRGSGNSPRAPQQASTARSAICHGCSVGVRTYRSRHIRRGTAQVACSRDPQPHSSYCQRDSRQCTRVQGRAKLRTGHCSAAGWSQSSVACLK
mmetsp:Transcript_75532/g.179434  ORF Transcript_75532/g.179434 Transcript_75532/m.179434 type:complete len:361 (+) Transcript_75532:449-1531(+)